MHMQTDTLNSYLSYLVLRPGTRTLKHTLRALMRRNNKNLIYDTQIQVFR